jgi:hypothetical protein
MAKETGASLQGATLEMRGDVVYRVYALHEGREKDCYFGTFHSTTEAEAEIAKLRAREMNGRNWAEQYHDRGFVIREAFVETGFEIHSQPKPRDKYIVKSSRKPSRPGTWDSTIVEVFRRTSSSTGLERICEYERYYSLLRTFEPFRQGIKEFALISFQVRRGHSEKHASAVHSAIPARRGDSSDLRCRDTLRSRIWKAAGVAATEKREL